MWTVNDGSGDLRIHNTSVYEYEPVEGSYYNITGPMNYDFDEWKIELSPAYPVTSGGDTDGPVVNEVSPVTSTNIRVIFNEDVEETTAEDISNYIIENIVVESADQHAFNKTEVNLTVTELSGDYEITIRNVEDMFGNAMEEQTIPFSYLGINELLLEGKVEVYPNPASLRMNISFVSLEAFNLALTISDISGRKMMHESYHAQVGANDIDVDVSDYDKGIYIINLRTEAGVLNQKLIIR
jgi:hypothetical protein